MSVLAGSSNQARERKVAGRLGLDTVMSSFVKKAAENDKIGVPNNQTKWHQSRVRASLKKAHPERGYCTGVTQVFPLSQNASVSCLKKGL
jgi:hypothetical protein